MSIKGLSKITKGKYSIFYIENFSDDIKNVIRRQLQGVFHGFAEIETLPDYYSYKNTLSAFFDRYDSKSEKIKKGMIGELLAHIIISCELNEITCLSILKNKEERSIKKGFDIIYCNNLQSRIWYAEVKSGNRSIKNTCSIYNSKLLNRAKSGIQAMIDAKRSSLWDSALIDANLMIREKVGRINIKKLLYNDSPIATHNTKKSVILISSLYSDLSQRIDPSSVEAFMTKLIGEDIFEDVIIISIQKSMYQTVAQFLKNEQLNS